MTDDTGLVTPSIRKVAVDALYGAREEDKVMDEAAAAVAEAVLVEHGAEIRLTIPDLVDGFAEGTLCPAAADTIRAIVAEKRADVPQPAYPALLLDLLATTLAGVWEHLYGEGVEGDVVAALDRYCAEVGRENVPAAVDKAIAELSAG